MPRTVDLVFDKGPGPELAGFIEAETVEGTSVNVGDWIERPDGTWALRLELTGDW